MPIPLLPPGNELNNREWATLIWLVVAVAWMLSRNDIRPSIWSVVRTAAKPAVVIPALVLWSWSVLLVVLAARAHLWTGDLLKDTVIWLIAPALGIYLSIMKVEKDPHFFRNVVKDAIRYTVLIEFYVNLRVFSLPIELVLLPTVTILVVLSACAASDEKYKPAKTLADAMTSIAGVGVLVYVTVSLIGGWRQENLAHDLRDLALPIWLTVGALPYLFGFSLLVGYESQFLRIDFWTKGNPDARRRAKLALLVELNVRTHLVHGLSGHWFNDLAQARTFAESRDIVRRYRIEQTRSLRPAA